MEKTVRAIPATISRYTSSPINSRKKRKVAGYARVSTDHDDQITSYEAQVDYYTNYIKGRDDWEFVGIYTDDSTLRLIQKGGIAKAYILWHFREFKFLGGVFFLLVFRRPGEGHKCGCIRLNDSKGIKKPVTEILEKVLFKNLWLLAFFIRRILGQPVNSTILIQV